MIENFTNGHRQRLKNKFLKSDLGIFPDYEILEMLLFLSIPRKDVKNLAKELLAYFGSLNKVLHADTSLLSQFNGIGPSTLNVLKLFREINFRLNKETIISQPILSSKNELIQYFRSSIGYSKTEKLHIVYLDNKNRLIHDEIIQYGTTNRICIYPREIVKKAIHYHASAIILVHNHPSGNTTPSQADIQQTQNLKEALSTIEVKLHDHIIISSNGYYSFKTNELLTSTSL